MITETILIGIKSVEFVGNSIMFVHLDNERTFIVPLEKFEPIQRLSVDDRKDFEIMDDKYLSFLAIDEVYSVEELIGLV